MRLMRRLASQLFSRRSPTTVLLFVLVLFAAGCASTGPKPGTGAIAFRLHWTGAADLDLYVLSPLGERIDFIQRQVASGGVLDIDCNVGGEPCASPMENVFWPRGDAPKGSYQYWIVVANTEGLEEADTYRLQVLVRGQPVTEWQGTLGQLLTDRLRANVDYS